MEQNDLECLSSKNCILIIKWGNNEVKISGGVEMEPIKQINQCGICEEAKDHGIHLYRLFICSECERNIICTEPREEKYNYYLQKLKNIDQSSVYL